MRPRATAATRVSRGHRGPVSAVRPDRRTSRMREGRGTAILSVALSGLSLDLSRKAALHCAAASLRAISAARLNVSQRSHLRPIDVVVCHGPQRRPHLGAGFALRCLQRLSDPDAATRLRAWRHDRHTVGPSDPVLSY